LILGELTNIHNWRFGRSFARPVPAVTWPIMLPPAVRVLCGSRAYG